MKVVRYRTSNIWRLLPVSGFLALFAAAVPVYASEVLKDTEYHMLVLDRSGSMVFYDWRWPTAVHAARSWVQQDFEKARNVRTRGDFETAPAARAYGIYTFRNADDQSGLVQVWPRVDGADSCEVFKDLNADGTPDESTRHVLRQENHGSQRFCVIETRVARDVRFGYPGVKNKLTEIQATHLPVVGAANGRGTPLAASLCDAVSTLRQTSLDVAAAHTDIDPSDVRRTITFLTDAVEIGTPEAHVCFGEDHSGRIEYDFSVKDWGMPTDIWQYQATKRSYYADLSTAEVFESPEPLSLPPSPDGTRPRPAANLHWRVGLQFGFCTPNPDFPDASSEPCLCEPNHYLSELTNDNREDWCLDADRCTANPDFDPDAPDPNEPICLSRANARDDIESTIPAPTRVPASRVPDPALRSDFDMFVNLGSSTEDSEFQGHGYLPRQAYGVERSTPGDVDRDGCVTRADLERLIDPEVFDHRALPGEAPQSIIDADLDQDGWVSVEDRRIVLANLGRGCTDPDLIPSNLPAEPRLDLKTRNRDRYNDSCHDGSFAPQFKVTNWSDEPYPLNGVNIRMGFATDSEDVIEFVNAEHISIHSRSGRRTGQYGQAQAFESSPPAACVAEPGRVASRLHHLQLSAYGGPGVMIPAHGGFALVSARYRRSGGEVPFDVDCDDFSQLRGSGSRQFVDDPHFSLVVPSAEVPQAMLCEYEGATTADAHSGIDAGVLSCGYSACEAPGHCGEDTDCDDDNGCTRDRCVDESCWYEPVHTSCASDEDECTDDFCHAGECRHIDNGTCDDGCRHPSWSTQSSYTTGDIVLARCDVNYPGTGCYNHQGETFAWRCDAPTWCGIKPGSASSGWWVAWTPVGMCDALFECQSHADCDDRDACTVDRCEAARCRHEVPTGGCATPNPCTQSAWSASANYGVGDTVLETCHVNFPGTPCYGERGSSFVWRCDQPTWCNIEPGSNTAGWWTAWTPTQECP